jgi:hypothetical protein
MRVLEEPILQKKYWLVVRLLSSSMTQIQNSKLRQKESLEVKTMQMLFYARGIMYYEFVLEQSTKHSACKFWNVFGTISVRKYQFFGWPNRFCIMTVSLLSQSYQYSSFWPKSKSSQTCTTLTWFILMQLFHISKGSHFESFEDIMNNKMMVLKQLSENYFQHCFWAQQKCWDLFKT